MFYAHLFETLSNLAGKSAAPTEGSSLGANQTVKEGNIIAPTRLCEFGEETIVGAPPPAFDFFIGLVLGWPVKPRFVGQDVVDEADFVVLPNRRMNAPV